MNVHGNIPGNQWNVKIETQVRKSLSNLKEAVKSHLQGKEMGNIPQSTSEKTPSKIAQGKKALNATWTDGKREISSRVQNLGIGKMLQTQSSNILERLKENHKTAPKEKPTTTPTSSKSVTFATPLHTEIKTTPVNKLVSSAKNGATPEELKEAGKNLFKFSTNLDKEALATITQNLSSEQLSHVIVGALQAEITQHVSTGNVLRGNTTGNQLLTQFALSHLSKEFNNSEKLQSLLSSIPKENLASGDGFTDDAIPQSRQFLNNYLDTTQNILSSQSDEMKLFKGIIKETAQNIDDKFGAEVGAGNTAGTNLLFLRVLNPIISTPEARGITTEKREVGQMKNAVLFTKIAQNMANNLSFGAKEPKMTVFNELLEEQKTRMADIKSMLV